MRNRPWMLIVDGASTITFATLATSKFANS
jgi:hypothetical protein